MARNEKIHEIFLCCPDVNLLTLHAGVLLKMEKEESPTDTRDSSHLEAGLDCEQPPVDIAQVAAIIPSPQRPISKPKGGRGKKQNPSEPAAKSKASEPCDPCDDVCPQNMSLVLEEHSSVDAEEPISDQIQLPVASNDTNFVDIDKLQDGGINVADLKKLKEAGLHSAMAVIYTTRKDLCNIRGMSDTKVDKIQEIARKLTDAGFQSGTDYMKSKLSYRFYISTGAANVNKLLGGGIESSSITELFGEFRCGKTQICHSLAVLCQLGSGPSGGGHGAGKCCYIDTENTFRPDRIQTIAAEYHLNPNTVLSNIMYARCYNSDHLWQLLVCAAARMAEEKFSLLVIDSIMAPFRVDYSGRGELAERQQHLGRFLVKLQKMSEEFNIAVVITNQVMSDPGAAMTFAANPPKPIGGHIMAHFSTTRLALRKGRGEQRIMKIYDSPCLPEGDAVYEICARGIQDAKD